jgi:single-stranded DNA-specific DHH superfamily exonuclease
VKGDAIDFLKNLKGKVKIVTHRDTDGVCALAILLKFLDNREVDEEHEFMEAYIDKLSKEKQMIFLDLSLDNVSKFITSKTLVIDHHPYSNKINNVAFYNPREIDPNAYIPAAYLVYEIISEIEDIKNLKWIAAVGVVGDRGDLNSDICKNFIKEFNRDNLELASRYIFSAELVDHNKGLENVLQILRNSRNLEEFLQNSYLRECYEKAQKEIIASKKKIEKEDNIIFVELDTKLNIKSIIASQFLEKYENIVVVVYYLRENYYYISARTNIDINLGEAFKKAASSVGGVGGGHEKAAGARIDKDKIDVFKEELISEINKLKT